METLFLICALFGGTFILCQFVLSLLGLGDAGHTVDVDSDHSGFGQGHASSDAHDGSGNHYVTWLFGVISMRTLVAAFTFFGLAGMVANRSGWDPAQQLLFAIPSGAIALFGVHWLMQSFHQLGQNSTLQIQHAVGHHATVSLAIPEGERRVGKVQLEIQGRLEEVTAVAPGTNAIPKGTKVRISGLVSSNVVEIEPIHA